MSELNYTELNNIRQLIKNGNAKAYNVYGQYKWQTFNNQTGKKGSEISSFSGVVIETPSDTLYLGYYKNKLQKIDSTNVVSIDSKIPIATEFKPIEYFKNKEIAYSSTFSPFSLQDYKAHIGLSTHDINQHHRSMGDVIKAYDKHLEIKKQKQEEEKHKQEVYHALHFYKVNQDTIDRINPLKINPLNIMERYSFFPEEFFAEKIDQRVLQFLQTDINKFLSNPVGNLNGFRIAKAFNDILRKTEPLNITLHRVPYECSKKELQDDMEQYSKLLSDQSFVNFLKERKQSVYLFADDRLENSIENLYMRYELQKERVHIGQPTFKNTNIVVDISHKETTTQVIIDIDDFDETGFVNINLYDINMLLEYGNDVDVEMHFFEHNFGQDNIGKSLAHHLTNQNFSLTLSADPEEYSTYHNISELSDGIQNNEVDVDFSKLSSIITKTLYHAYVKNKVSPTHKGNPFDQKNK